MKKRLLVVDDEAVIRDIVMDCVGDEYETATAVDVASGLAALDADPPDLLLVDVRMPGGNGLDLARRALDRYPDLGVVVVTGHGTMDDFLAAFRLGVADFVLKPFGPTTLRKSLRFALQTRRLRAENARLRAEARSTGDGEALLGGSESIEGVRQAIRSVAPTTSTVLVTGPSGTGKELAARMVHALSPRAHGPFVAVHCGALPDSLLEPELFGHARGAFTGACGDRRGRIEEANGGTLFLDEVGTMSAAAQVRLLRVLAAGDVTPVGADTPRKVDVRFVAATNADLAQLVREGRFRADLRHRLDVFRVVMPTLRERRADIPLLAGAILSRACARVRRPKLLLSQDAVRQLMAHPWQGNVRELENVMGRAAILAPPGGTVEVGDLLLAQPRSPAIAAAQLPAEGLDLPAFLKRLEADLIHQAVALCGSNGQAAASLLRVHRSTLAHKIRRLPAPPQPKGLGAFN